MTLRLLDLFCGAGGRRGGRMTAQWTDRGTRNLPLSKTESIERGDDYNLIGQLIACSAGADPALAEH